MAIKERTSWRSRSTSQSGTRSREQSNAPVPLPSSSDDDIAPHQAALSSSSSILQPVAAVRDAARALHSLRRTCDAFDPTTRAYTDWI